MRRKATLVFCTALLALVLAPPALAQKDPFDPLLTEGDPGAPVDSTDVGEAGDPTTTTTVADPASDEPMPTTGSDPSSWVGLAVLALALGGGLLLLSRVLGPAPRRRGS